MSENGARLSKRDSARKIIGFIKQQQPHGRPGRRMVLRMIAVEYRNRHACQCDESIRKLIRYGKDAEGVSEEDFLIAAQEILHGVDEPVIYPDDERPEIILGPEGSVLWMRTSKKEKETPSTSGESSRASESAA